MALFCVRARSSSSCAGSEDNIVGTFKLRDFISKMGRMTNSDRDFGFSSFMSNFGMGTRNEMGEHLLNFLCCCGALRSELGSNALKLYYMKYLKR